MKKFLKIAGLMLLWALLFIVAGAGLYVLYLKAEIAPETAALIFGLFAALVLGAVLLRRFFIRRNQRRRIMDIVTLDRRPLADTPQEKHLLENRWKRAVALLRASYLGRFGNPVYALPWYMVMGRSGAGKSSAIRHSGLHAMQTDVGPDQDSPATRNCDWWFFQEAVVLDTAGRYAIPENEAADEAEWREFLFHLAKYRRKEPLNGLVLAVSSESLHGDGSHLKNEARCLRRRVDEIMRILGARFPVYLMVTKIDLPPGMAGVLDELPQQWKAQYAGGLVQSPEARELTPVALQVKKALHEAMGRFRALCLYGPAESCAPRPHRLLALEEMKARMPALAAFAEEVFMENPYQETPLLRGVFFSSALHAEEQAPSGAFPRLEDFVRRCIRGRRQTGGVFLHDFFRVVLPRDRNLYRPIAEYIRWRSAGRVLAYAAMLVVTFGIGFLLSLSFRHNETCLRRMAFEGGTMLDQGAISNVYSFERLYRNASELDALFDANRLPWMGLTQAVSVRDRFNARLAEAFEIKVLYRADRTLEGIRGKVNEQTADAEYAALMGDLIWRYELIDAALKGADEKSLLAVPAMPYAMLDAIGGSSIPSLAPILAYTVTEYYARQKDPEALRQHLRAVRSSLARMPALKNYSLQWLVERVSTQGRVSPIQGGLFWSGNVAGDLNVVRIDPAYTAAGFRWISEYVENLSAIIGQEVMQPHAQAFRRWYAGRYVTAWRRFAEEFSREVSQLAQTNTVSDYMPLMASEGNPFFLFALRMDEELRPVRPFMEDTPPWVNDLSLWSDTMRLADRQAREADHAGLGRRVADMLGSVRDEFVVQLSEKETERQARMEDLYGYHQKYLASLAEIVRFTATDEIAFQAVKSAMPDPKNADAASAPLNMAGASCTALQSRINSHQAPDSPVLVLTRGPLAFFSNRLINQAACQIQELWEEDVLSRAGGVSPLQLQQTLFAETGGLARQFADTTMQLFLRRTLSGYVSQRMGDAAVPFRSEFLQFLNEGVLRHTPLQREYAVTVNTIPVDVNDGAHEQPYAVILSLDCARDRQELVNYNSPASKQFVWRQADCGDTRLSVRFRSATVDVLYPGEQGFVSFLHDFRYGTKRFDAAQFPAQAPLLKSMGVTDITLRYAFTGAETLLAGTTYAPGTLPFVITQCRR